ncbi:unnamed protein product [Prorocentrum cordatum]|uniref:Uncharacterized protein n=1 Tax=Prorocentrum cordatum TaxID=2364126 RepID=A0ABN9R6F9_9DINO|nr:unnamed protein product [Polarella glacialis]
MLAPMASSDHVQGGAACCGKSWRCCNRARFENGIDRYTLRFVDPMQEAGFARNHKALLSQYVGLTMGVFAAGSLLTSLTGHRFWDNSQYATTEAQELSRWQLIIQTVTTSLTSNVWPSVLRY